MTDKELEVYYEQLMDTFATPGWKAIMEKVAEIKTSLNDLASTQDEKEFWLKKGRVAELNYWLQFEQLHRDAYAEVVNGSTDV